MESKSKPTEEKKNLYLGVVDTLNRIFGKHPGYRPVHAKGIICRGSFLPTRDAAAFCRAPHFQHVSTQIIVRFSNFSGNPETPDADDLASPRGMAIRFHLTDGRSTDIVAHSYNGFPVGSVEDFLAFLQALAASTTDSPKPTPLEKFLESHPGARKFIQEPKRTPASFAALPYYGADTFRFLNAGGESHLGRYFICPYEEESYVDPQDASKMPANFLFDELRDRLSREPVMFRLIVQLPGSGDPTSDASYVWQDDRQQVELGTLQIESVDPNSAQVEREMVFDALGAVDGIELADDMLPQERSEAYIVSFERRRQ